MIFLDDLPHWCCWKMALLPVGSPCWSNRHVFVFLASQLYDIIIIILWYDMGISYIYTNIYENISPYNHENIPKYSHKLFQIPRLGMVLAQQLAVRCQHCVRKLLIVAIAAAPEDLGAPGRFLHPTSINIGKAQHGNIYQLPVGNMD